MNYSASQENTREDQSTNQADNHILETRSLEISMGIEADRNRTRCELCNLVSDPSDAQGFNLACPHSQIDTPSLQNASRLSSRPQSLRPSGYIPPISRPFQLPGLNASDGFQPSQNGIESFTLSFLKRTTRSPEGAVVSEIVIPVVQLIPTIQTQSDPTTSLSHSPLVNTLTMVRVMQVINRLFQDIHDMNNVNENEEANWNSTMDENHSFNTTINPNQFPFIVFAVGNNIMNDTQISDILENLIARPADNGRMSATQDQLNRLAKYSYPEESCGTECSVCQADYRLGDKLVKLPCSHDYHEDCVTKWLKQNASCPICRKSLSSNNSQ